MTSLENLTPGAALRGILPDALVTVVSVQWFGSEALELTYKTPTGKVANELLYRHDEPRLEVVEHGRPWSFDGDGALFRLVSEAQRIRLAHLFDPVLAVHTSLVEPLPHQITAVYETMLPRQPLRFLLADDPGAGKTIMAGLLMKELIARGDLQRCLVVCPGSLAEQWQDELYRRFHLPFEILTNDKLEAARTGNWFLETNLVIARLDKLVAQRGRAAEAPGAGLPLGPGRLRRGAQDVGHGLWRRDQVHQALQAGPAPLDPHAALPADDGHAAQRQGRGLPALHGAARRRPLRGPLPRWGARGRCLRPDAPHGQGEACSSSTARRSSRSASPTPCPTSSRRAEAHLYKAVTDYVREEFNRAEALQNDKRAGTVGFALTILQRRLASSPEAIYQSLRRRRERLEKRLRELELLQRGAAAGCHRGRHARARRRRRRRPGRSARQRGRGGRGGDPRPGHRRAHHRRAEGRDRDLEGPGSAGPRRPPQRRGHQVARAGQPARRDLHARSDRRPPGRRTCAAYTARRPSRSRCRRRARSW